MEENTEEAAAVSFPTAGSPFEFRTTYTEKMPVLWPPPAASPCN